MPLNISFNVLEKEKNGLMKELKSKRGSEVFCFFAQITRPSVSGLCDMLHQIKKKPEQIDIIIDSTGGDIDAAYHTSKILSQVATKRLTFIVPRMAKSAATLMVCGGDEIIMGDSSELGPLDPQIILNDGSMISGLSVRSTLDLIEQEIKDKNIEVASILANKLNPLHIGEMNRTLEISKQYLKELLLNRMFKGKEANEVPLQEIIDKLATGYTHHSYIIDYDEAKKLNLNVKKPQDDEWDLIWKIYNINQQEAQLQAIQRDLIEYQVLKKFLREKTIYI